MDQNLIKLDATRNFSKGKSGTQKPSIITTVNHNDGSTIAEQIFFILESRKISPLKNIHMHAIYFCHMMTSEEHIWSHTYDDLSFSTIWQDHNLAPSKHI